MSNPCGSYGSPYFGSPSGQVPYRPNYGHYGGGFRNQSSYNMPVGCCPEEGLPMPSMFDKSVCPLLIEGGIPDPRVWSQTASTPEIFQCYV